MLLPPFFVFLPCTIPVPAPRPCLTCTAFSSALVRSAALLQRLGDASPASIISGDGYSIVEVCFSIIDCLFH